MQEANQDAPAPDSGHSVVGLNVGGIVFHTTLQTLRKDQASMLATMFAAERRIGLSLDKQGNYFVDFDGRSFGEVLNFLRNDGTFSVPGDRRDRDHLLATANFFQITELCELLEQPGAQDAGLASSSVRFAGRNLASLNISGLCISNLDLSGADLSNVNLRRVNLSHANLTGVNLVRAKLSESKLEGTVLANANLEAANLFASNLAGAQLSGAVLDGCILSECVMSRATMRGCRLSGATLHRTDLSLSVLVDSVLCDCDLRRAVLQGADLSRVDLRRARLDSTDLRQSVLKEANLEGVVVAGDTLVQGSVLQDCVLRHSRGWRAWSFHSSNMLGADLRGADLSASHFTRDHGLFYGCKSDQHTLFGSRKLPARVIERGGDVEDEHADPASPR